MSLLALLCLFDSDVLNEMNTTTLDIFDHIMINWWSNTWIYVVVTGFSHKSFVLGGRDPVSVFDLANENLQNFNIICHFSWVCWSLIIANWLPPTAKRHRVWQVFVWILFRLSISVDSWRLSDVWNIPTKYIYKNTFSNFLLPISRHWLIDFFFFFFFLAFTTPPINLTWNDYWFKPFFFWFSLFGINLRSFISTETEKLYNCCFVNLSKTGLSTNWNHCQQFHQNI